MKKTKALFQLGAIGLLLTATQCRADENSFGSAQRVDLTKMKFSATDMVTSQTDGVLTLKGYFGWAWAALPDPIDLNANPVLTIRYRAPRDTGIYLELKSRAGAVERGLVGKKSYHGHPKVPVRLDATGAETGTVTINLTPHRRKEAGSPEAVVICFSDPQGSIEILEISFAPGAGKPGAP